MLEVVEQHQHPPVTQMPLYGLKQSLARHLPDAQRPGEDGWDHGRIPQGRQGREDHAVGESLVRAPGHL